MASQEARKAETRQRLLDAAADLFATKGVHAVSLEAIAEAADRTTGAIYSHFGGKVGLLLALLDQTSRQVGRDTRRALDGIGDTELRLEALWKTFVHRADDIDDPWMLLEHELWLYAARNPETREQLAERFAHARTVMGASFDSWMDTPERLRSPNGDSPRLEETPNHEHAATLVLALLYGLEMQRRVDPPAVSDGLAVLGLRALLALDPTEHSTNHEREHHDAH